jgi:hypothetical protein
VFSGNYSTSFVLPKSFSNYAMRHSGLVDSAATVQLWDSGVRYWDGRSSEVVDANLDRNGDT